jgi:hypothetical protein
MRNELAKLYGRRAVFTARIGRFGNKPGFPSWRGTVPTVLLKQITNTNGVELCDHAWLEAGGQWERLGLGPGDRVRFSARVSGYDKGERGFDYRFAAVAKVEKL